MAIFKRSKDKAQAGPEHVKENPVGVIDAGYAKIRPAPYCKRLILEQLSRHPLAALCVRKIASEASQVRFIVDVQDGITEAEATRLTALLDSPNPEYSGQRLRRMVFMSMAGVGDAFLSEFREANGTLTEIWPMRMDRMTAKRDVGVTGKLTGWDYEFSGRKKHFNTDEIVHFQHDWLTMDEYGVSVAETITDLLKYWDGYMAYNNRLLDGTQAVAAMYGLKTGEEPLSADQMKQITSLMASFKTAVTNGNIGARAFFNAPLEKIDDGHNPQDMQVTGWFNQLTNMILNAYQVPPILLDVGSNATFENMNTALESFWFNTLIPNYVQPVAEDLSRWLGVKVRPEYGEVRAIANALCAQAVKVDSLGHLTINEKREMSGRPPVEGGDQIYTDASRLPIDFGFDTPDAVERSIAQVAKERGIRLVK